MVAECLRALKRLLMQLLPKFVKIGAYLQDAEPIRTNENVAVSCCAPVQEFALPLSGISNIFYRSLTMAVPPRRLTCAHGKHRQQEYR